MSVETTRAAGMLIYRIVGDVQYLMLQCSFEKTNWGPPKGHVDPGEDTMTTAIRETVEESGLKSDQYEIEKDFEPFYLKYTARGKPKSVEFWLAKLKDPKTPIILSREHTDYTWMNLQQAAEKLPYKDLIEAIKKADAFLSEKQSTNI